MQASDFVSGGVGQYQETFPRGYVRMRWDPQNPTKQTISLPVSVEQTLAGPRPQVINAGMIISLDENGTHWVRGVREENTNPSVVCFAQDASTDRNVIHANSLVGLPCSDRFVLVTPFFARGTAGSPDAPMYLPGTLLTYCKAGEKETRTINNTQIEISLEGFVRPVESEDEPVIGIVSPGYPSAGINGSGPVAAGTVPSATNSVNAAEPLQLSFINSVNSHVIKENAYQITYLTAFQPKFSK